MQLARARLRPRAGERVRLALVLGVCGVLLVVTMTLGVGAGPVALSQAQVWHVIAGQLTGRPDDTVTGTIVWQIRVPRVLLAALVGAALAAMAAVFAVSRSGHGLAPTQLILCGVVLSALFESITSFLIFRGNPQATQSVLFWLLGSFGLASWDQLPIPALALAAAMIYLLAQGGALNALAMGAEPAAALGVDVRRLRRNLFLVTSLMAGVAVAVSGIIGFVGLVVPHIVRLMVGSDHRRVLPAGVLFGASFMVLGDLLARTIVAPQEMPIGVITAFIGAPTLIVLIRRRPYLYGATQ